MLGSGMAAEGAGEGERNRGSWSKRSTGPGAPKEGRLGWWASPEMGVQESRCVQTERGPWPLFRSLQCGEAPNRCPQTTLCFSVLKLGRLQGEEPQRSATFNTDDELLAPRREQVLSEARLL